MYGTERERRGAAVTMTARVTHPCTPIDRIAAAALAAAALEPTGIQGSNGEVVYSIELGRYEVGAARYHPLLEVWPDRP